MTDPNEFTEIKESIYKGAIDLVNYPAHYTSHPSGIECIQITRHMNFNLGNAMKYIWRAGEKGKPIEDLEKAIWYLNDEIARLASIELDKMKKPATV